MTSLRSFQCHALAVPILVFVSGCATHLDHQFLVAEVVHVYSRQEVDSGEDTRWSVPKSGRVQAARLSWSIDATKRKGLAGIAQAERDFQYRISYLIICRV